MTNFTQEFIEMNRPHLEHMLELGVELDRVHKPTWAFQFGDATFKLGQPGDCLPSDFDDRMYEDPFIRWDEQLEELNTMAYRRVRIVYGAAIVAQMQKEGISPGEAGSETRQGFLRLRPSDARIALHNYARRDPITEAGVYTTHVSGEGPLDKPIQASSTRIETYEDRIIENFLVMRATGELIVNRTVRPRYDDISERLKVFGSLGIVPEEVKPVLLRAVLLASFGAEISVEMIEWLRTKSDRMELTQLYDDILQRQADVKGSEALVANSHTPDENQLREAIELLEEMVETSEE